ncbi:hypothetical protein BH20VER1_BH20VER1_03460 [soil metagenome]
MTFPYLLPLITVGATLMLVLTGLLNFTVFLRQLRASRELLETARWQLENARQGPEIQLFQRAMSETSEHLSVLLQRPYLRPYFYENKAWREGDQTTADEVKIMAELLLDNLASAIIHSAAFPQYPIRSVEQTIRFHLRNSPALREFLMEAFDRFQMAGLALLRLKNETKEQTEADLQELINACGTDDVEKQRRQRLLHHLQTTTQPEPVELARYSLERKRKLSGGSGTELAPTTR